MKSHANTTNIFSSISPDSHTFCLFYSYEGAVQMGISRYLHSTVVVGTKLYVVGGLDETQSLQATMYVADPNNKYQVSIIYTCR